MKSKILLFSFIVAILLFSADFIASDINPVAQDVNVKPSFRYTLTKLDDATMMNFDIERNSVALIGREFWKKGEEIEISFHSNRGEVEELKVGIVPADDLSKGYGYESYGTPITETVFNLKNLATKVKFVIPNDGEYGLFVQDCSPSIDSFVHEREMPVTGEGKFTTSFEKNVKKSVDYNLKKDDISLALRVDKFLETL